MPKARESPPRCVLIISTFIGAIDSGIIPPAAFATTTSMICDGNVNTFRHLSQKHHVPCYMLDIPNDYSPDALHYVVDQLEEMIRMLEQQFGKKMDLQRLSEILERENLSKNITTNFCRKRVTKIIQAH